ncbi:bifunctional serine/threonine-protein kinase/formylglycine-generating enzyme family protein [uncultured Thiodictyon sp.]|uniref:bifunctional serine/threonine-protein kinase/formylglycine-generating enzyme family protein n=1 Tax=uncultured Thiodictyon sp. TaxID=1846217 RepID=UPI0025F86FAF|nr:bifunctional serine/threonine-protein kinase/formylglycine-generating enzyme family protein [uncultured Thiodictyon sp.]
MTETRIATQCPGCFAAPGRSGPCSRCGYDECAGRSGFLLPHRTLLHGQYLVGKVLGKPGTFGITYLGWDQRLETLVAIKEYLPREWAGRATDALTVVPHSREDEGGLFQYGLDRFLVEARTLARIDHPHVVRVRTYFPANGTAYLVMDYYPGFSLAEHLEQRGGRLPEDEARQLILPILEGLSAVHAKGFLHRDIKPLNIYLAQTEGGASRPLLLDFGAARAGMGERSRTVIYSGGYSPIEQYHEKGKQGPWTDIYSTAAVFYRLVTGKSLPESIARLVGDPLKPAADFGVSQALSDTLTVALAMQPEERPQTVADFQTRLVRSDPLPEMVRIPAGRFSMGCQPGEKECEDDEKPAHWVKVAAFELGKFAVTFDEWDACVADGGCSHQPDDAGWGRGKRPVIDVSWDDALQYVTWLSRKTGKTYRLPTEAEWEYAARAGTTTAFSTGDCINTDQANYDGDDDHADCGAKTGVYLGKTQPVGSYPANPWGLYDMHGNVWEWVQDCWHGSYTGAPQDGSAWLDSSEDSGRRVVRGGSWGVDAMVLRTALRGRVGSGSRYDALGFRVARTLAP